MKKRTTVATVLATTAVGATLLFGAGVANAADIKVVDCRTNPTLRIDSQVGDDFVTFRCWKGEGSAKINVEGDLLSVSVDNHHSATLHYRLEEISTGKGHAHTFGIKKGGHLDASAHINSKKYRAFVTSVDIRKA